MVTIEDAVMDTAIREMAYRTDLFGAAGTFADPQKVDSSDLKAVMHWKAGPLQWNPDYTPWFYRDIWPILFRADEMSYLSTILGQSNFPHNQSTRGNFDPFKLGVPPVVAPRVLARLRAGSAARNHSGQLYEEALEPVLMVLDDQLKQLPHAHAGGFLDAMDSGDSQSHDLRHRLLDALSEFANTVYGPFSEGDPDAYLSAWQEAYVRNDGNYQAAKKTLEDRVQLAIEELYERAARPKPGVTLMLTRRTPEDGETRVDRQSLDLRAAANRYLNEFLTGRLLERQFKKDTSGSTLDAYRQNRLYLDELLRQPGEENEFRLAGRPNSRLFRLPLMPLLAGDNPISNTLPSKFLRLTDYQLFILRQWAAGKFVNEVSAGWVKKEDVNPFNPYQNWVNRTAQDLDRAVLMNLLGGAFCPGGEVNWIIRNPAVYEAPFRLKADPDFWQFRQTAAQANANAGKIPVSENDYISSTEDDLSQDSDFKTGLQPGDLTKYMALPWQADFNECTTQPIDVTYELWNTIYPGSENDEWAKLEQKVWETLWWPAHRPVQVFEVVGMQGGEPVYKMLEWSMGVPGTNAGDLKMVTEWPRLGFLVRNFYLTKQQQEDPTTNPPAFKYISVERNQEER